MKKLTSVLLSVVMLMSVLCMPALATGGADCLKAVANTAPGVVVVEISASEATPPVATDLKSTKWRLKSYSIPSTS